MGLYGATSAPGLTWQHDGVDGGDLVSAAYSLGVAHPPGYPTYLLMGKAFSLIPWGNVAHRLDVMSATFAAAAVLMTCWTTARLAKAAGASETVAALAAMVSALALATSTILWSQAVIAEVYTTYVFFLAAVVLCLLRWRQSPGQARWLWLAALLGGLGLGSHLTLALTLLPAAAWVFLWRHPSRRALAGASMSFVLGLSVFLYLPWRAAHNPPINWGDAATWSGFWRMVSAAPYRDLAFGLPWGDLPQRISALANLLGSQLQWWGLFMALIGVRCLWQKDRPWALFSVVVGFMAAIYATMYNTTDSYVYLLPLAVVLSWWLGMGIVQMVEWLSAWRGISPVHMAGMAVGLVLLVPGVSVARSYSYQDLSHSRDAEYYALGVWQFTEPNAIILSGRDAQLFALWYYSIVERPGTGRLVVAYPLLQYPWYQEQVRRMDAPLLPEGPLSYHPALEALVDNSIRRRPVYFTEDPSDILPTYRAVPAGQLWRLEPP